MSHHAVDLLKKYAEIVNESQSTQLDEGMLDSIKQKIMGLIGQVTGSPEAKQAIAHVKQQPGIKGQMMDILKSSKSADDVMAQVKQLGKSMAQQAPVNEGSIDGGMAATGAITSLLGTAGTIIEYCWHPIAAYITAGNASAAAAGVAGAVEGGLATTLIGYIIPVMIVIAGLTYMYYAYEGSQAEQGYRN